MYKKKHIVNCVTGSLALILNFCGYNVREEMLVADDTLLSLEIKDGFESVYKNIFMTIDKASRINGLILQRISTDEARRVLSSDTEKKNKLFLVNIDCHALTYSDFFVNAKTTQEYHFICIDDLKDFNNYHVHDVYIPGGNIDYFQGNVKIPIEYLNDAEFYSVDGSKYLEPTSDYLAECMYSATKLKVQEHNLDCYNRMINRVEEISIDFKDEYNQLNLQDIAIMMAIGGVIDIKKYVSLFLNRILYNNQTKLLLQNEIHELCNLHLKIRILLLKASMSSYPDWVINEALEKMKELADREIKLFASINRIMEDII